MGKDLERRFKLGIEKIKNNSLIEEEVYRENREYILGKRFHNGVK